MPRYPYRTRRLTPALVDPPDLPVARGIGVMVLYDYETGKSVPLPDDLRDRIRALDGID